MSTSTLAFGQLEDDGDTWFLVRPHDFLLLDLVLADMSFEHKIVSVVGRMGIPPSSPGIEKLIVDQFTTHDAIATRAYAISESGQTGSALDNWLRAERELLKM